MPVSPQEIIDAAINLPERERLAVANRLMESLPDELVALDVDDPELLNELDRRWHDRKDTIPWNSLRDEWPAK